MDIMSFAVLVAICYSVVWIPAGIYIKFGIGKWFYHDLLGWHEPDAKEVVEYDGVNTHCVCRHCKKHIMQDSQGNWFEA